MFLLGTEELAIILLLCCVVPIGGLIIAALILRIRNSKIKKSNLDEKINEQGIDQEQRTEFLNAYGGEENVQEVSIERNKVSVKVIDIEKVQGDALKELGASNVLLIGNEVRCSFEDRAEYVYNLIK